MMTQDEFDSLTIFIAVVEELQREPFFSEDNHDTLCFSKSGGEENDLALFCHPSFLKSAVIPFRKIWMSSERCAFCKIRGVGGIRDLVFREYHDRQALEGHHYTFYEGFEKELSGFLSCDGTKKSKREIINIWINTQVAHAGPKEPKNKKAWEFELKDFDDWATQIGREKFEYLFRTNLQTIGSYYISFAQELAHPVFRRASEDQKMVPGFEAELALKYSPYPDSRCNIIFDDVFWHIQRESMEETFDRLLTRHYFDRLNSWECLEGS